MQKIVVLQYIFKALHQESFPTFLNYGVLVPEVIFSMLSVKVKQ